MDVPVELRRLTQWVCWSDRDGTKKPLQPTGRPASSTNRDTWAEFVVCDRVKHEFSGLGFVFASDGDLFGVDLDGCIDADGTISDWACEIISLFKTYCEFSPSGTGVHLFGRGRLPDGKGRNRKVDQPRTCDKVPGVEVYDRGRYFTVTGQRIGDITEVADCQSALDCFLEIYWPTPTPIKPILPVIDAKHSLDLRERARRYLARMPPAVTGQGGHNATFRVACVLVLGFNLPIEEAAPLFQEWNANCQPPWSDRDLMHKLTDAGKREGQRGWLLEERGRYEGPDVDLRSLLASLHGFEEASHDLPPVLPVDPHGFPVDCLRTDGFLADVIEHNLATAIYPQPELAMAAAIALLSCITGGKICDRWGTRTNAYVLGLAPSGSGKDHARKLNRKILAAAGGVKLIGPERVGSHAGLISRLDANWNTLFQLDEIGRLFATMADPKRAPHLFNIGSVLMQLYSSADSIWVADAYAEAKKVKTLEYPHCVVYGTSVPDSFWQSLTAENVGDGLLGRFMVFESPGYADMHIPEQRELPASIIDRATSWLNLKTHGGNLAGKTNHEAASPILIGHTAEAFERTREHQESISKRRKSEDAPTAAVWSRTGEKTNKLALLFACSRAMPGESFEIELQDVEKAVKISNWLTRKMLRQAGLFVSDGRMDFKRKKALRKFEVGKPFSKSEFTRRTQFFENRRERDECLAELLETGHIKMASKIISNNGQEIWNFERTL